VKKPELTDREEKILRSIIETHVRTARPVSSSAVVRKRSVELSSATVRNVMRSLEEKGLISQPHTSAGRVPTDVGYRYYVDNIMHPLTLTESERAEVRGGLLRLTGDDIGSVAAGVSRTISEFARQLAVAVAPPVEGELIEQIKLVSLDGNRVLAVATTRTGQTQSAVLKMREHPSAGDLARAADLVSEWLTGAPVADIEKKMKDHLGEVSHPLRDVIAGLLAGSPQIFRVRGGERIHYEGARYILSHPEFSDDAAFLGEMFDDEEAMAELVRTRAGEGGVTVTIGRENSRKEMKRMSVVVGSYRVGSRFGQMGVIGPTRMRYSRLVGLVDYISEVLGDLLSERR
jgi:heat-inducible transcriptional repressor